MTPHGGADLSILSLACAYPNPLQPQVGTFVQRRLRHLARLARIRVVSPVPIFQYGAPAGTRIRIGRNGCPPVRQDGDIQVIHPRWFYPPFSGALTPCWLSAQIVYPLIRLKRDFPFMLIDTHFGYPDGIAGGLLSMALRVPFTMTLRGNEPSHARSGPIRQAMGWAVRRAARVFTVSERLRQFAIALGGDPAKVKTIPNGVDTDIFYPREKAACRVRHGLDTQIPLILSAGALIERKGHHRVVRAVTALAAARVKVQLAIAGGAGPEGNCGPEIRRAISAASLQNVRLLGPVSAVEMAELMSAADVLCLASTREGWPNVVNEALACGTPVVATDVGAVADMLPDPRYGLVVPVNDQAALDGAVRQAIQMDWDRSLIAAWGQRRSWDQVAREVLEEMRSLLGCKLDG